MRADFAIETPIKFFIVLVAAVLIITFIRNIYTQANAGIEDLIPQKQKEGYEVFDMGDVNSGQIASMADACGDLGSKQPGVKEEFGCYIIRGNFVNVNPQDIHSLSRYNLTVQISPGATAVFIDYHFPTEKVRVRS
jgi:hypothetical protein